MIRRSLQVLASAIAVTAVDFVVSRILPSTSQQTDTMLPVLLIANALTAGILIAIGVRSTTTRARRALLLAVVWASIQANYLVEGVAFDIGLSHGDAIRAYVHAVTISLVAGVVVAAVLWRDPPCINEKLEPISPLSLAGQLLLCGLAYFVFYMVAGTVLAWPIVQPFYEGRPAPALAPLLGLQIIRGAAFALTVLLIARRTSSDAATGDFVAGSTLAVLGGLAPLLPPNPYLPNLVRLAHLPEVVISNFVFGIVARRILINARHRTPLVEIEQTPS